MTTATVQAPIPQAIQQQDDKRRRTEADPDFARLHAATVRRLDRCLRELLRNLRRPDMGDADAQSAFIHHATDVLRSAYEEAHREGQRDYWHQVSLKRNPPLHQAPADETRTRQVLAWYAVASLTKMAREAASAAQAARHATKTASLSTGGDVDRPAPELADDLPVSIAAGSGPYRARAARMAPTGHTVSYHRSEHITLAGSDASSGDPLTDWYDGTDQRVALQASITWAGLQDGYADSGRMDPAAPFTLIYWLLEGAAAHCEDCIDMASNNPYNAPWVQGGNQLNQTPGDGRTVCGASCKCDLSYAPDTSADEQMAAMKWQYYLQNMASAAAQIGTAAGYEDITPNIATVTPSDALVRGALQLDAQSSVVPDAIPTPRTDVLSDDQKAALDRMRDANEAWDTLRGDLPEAPDMFARIEDVAGESGLPTGGMLPEWDALTPEQQHTISEMVAALWDWYAATEGDVGDIEQQFAEWADNYKLSGHPPGYDEQDHDPKTGQWMPGRGPLGGGIPSGGKKGRGRTGGLRKRAGTPEQAASNEKKIEEFYSGIAARQRAEEERSSGGGRRASKSDPNAPVTVEYENERAREYLTTAFGHRLTDAQVAGLAGAEPGAHVLVRPAGWLANDAANGAYHMESVVQPRSAAEGSQLRLMSWSYREPWYPESPYGRYHSAPVRAQAIRAQVIAARQTGVERIDVKAHAFNNDWVKVIQMGFDRPLDEHLWPELIGHTIPAAFHGRTIGQIALNNGRAGLTWWKGVKSSLSAYFDPWPGSPSMQRFNRYLHRHRIEEIPDL